MTMTDGDWVYVLEDDWAAIYHNGELYWDGEYHDLHKPLLELINAHVYENEPAVFRYMDKHNEFPSRLSEFSVYVRPGDGSPDD